MGTRRGVYSCVEFLSESGKQTNNFASGVDVLVCCRSGTVGGEEARGAEPRCHHDGGAALTHPLPPRHLDTGGDGAEGKASHHAGQLSDIGPTVRVVRAVHLTADSSKSSASCCQKIANILMAASC